MGGLPPFSGVRIIPGLHGASGSPFRAGFQTAGREMAVGRPEFPRTMPSVHPKGIIKANLFHKRSGGHDMIRGKKLFPIALLSAIFIAGCSNAQQEPGNHEQTASGDIREETEAPRSCRIFWPTNRKK
jgi:hypothetical protein